MRSRSSWRPRLELLETDAVDEVADEHTLAGQRADDLGHEDERVAVVDAGQRALVLGLELVVELLHDALPDLLGDGVDVEPRGHPLEQPHDHVEVLEVRPDGRPDARVLDLDGHLAAVVGEPGAVHLADRSGRDRLLVEVLEQLLDRVFEVIFDHPPHLA